MKLNPRKLYTIAIGLVATIASYQTMAEAKADQPEPPMLLSGDEKLACEATLCLVTSEPPSECNESLQRYHGIHFRNPTDTSNARADFLNKCPKN